MSKSKTGSGDRSSKVAKAGKRHGLVVYPLPANLDTLAGREQGEQQFIAKKQLIVEREATIIVYDKALKGFVYRTKKITLPTDYVWDDNRKRVISSPKFKEHK